MKNTISSLRLGDPPASYTAFTAITGSIHERIGQAVTKDTGYLALREISELAAFDNMATAAIWQALRD